MNLVLLLLLAGPGSCLVLAATLGSHDLVERVRAKRGEDR